MDIIATLPDTLITTLAFIALYVFLVVIAKWSKDLFTPYSLNEQLAEKDNPAVAMTMAGYYLSVSMIFVAALAGPTFGLGQDIINTTAFSLCGILLLNLSRWVNDKMILRKFCNISRLTEEQDIGVGTVQFGVYIATGLIASGALTGEGNFVSFLVFFVLGQASLVLFSYLYNAIAPFDIHSELENKNVAAGVGFSGILIALGLIIMTGVSGDFENWTNDIVTFAINVIIAFIFLPLLMLLIDRLIVPGKSLNREIKEDKNIGAGLLNAAVSIGFATVLINII